MSAPPMTATEFAQTRERLGYTREELAAVLEVTPRALQYWETGDRGVPGPVRVALRLMLAGDKAMQAELRRLRRLEREVRLRLAPAAGKLEALLEETR